MIYCAAARLKSALRTFGDASPPIDDMPLSILTCLVGQNSNRAKHEFEAVTLVEFPANCFLFRKAIRGIEELILGVYKAVR